MRLLASVLAAALVAAAGTGCSEDDKNANGADGTTTGAPAATTATVTSPPPPSEPINEWAQQADAICSRFQQRIEAVPPPANRAQARRALARALVPIRRQERALKKLGPPTDNQAIGLAFIGSIVSTRKALEQIVAGFAADDDARVQAGYTRAGAAGARTRTYAEQLGLVHCGAPRRG